MHYPCESMRSPCTHTSQPAHAPTRHVREAIAHAPSSRPSPVHAVFTSLNEVTPMVIAEAMMRSLPVITTDIAGIPEMLEHGVHGFVLPPDDPKPFEDALEQLGAPGPDGQRRRLQMGAAAKKHALETFTNGGMVAAYREAAMQMAAPIVLVDMDGVLVDWDAGFLAAWAGRSTVDRSQSYAMEECVPPELKEAARAVFHAPGFFRGLPPMAGGVEAVRELARLGYRVYLCTAPVLTSSHCAGEKFEWVRAHLGTEWVGRIILTSDKTAVRGDVLIDDKARITGAHHPVWQHLRFDAPYNRGLPAKHTMASWAGVAAALEAVITSAPPVRPTAEGGAADDDDEPAVSKQAVAALPDFSHLLPADYRKDYAAWRSGRPQGAKGELRDAMVRFAAMQDSLLNSMSEDFTEVSIYRLGYAGWRQGRASGAKSLAGGVSQL